jgi:hypothetical protein
MLRKSHDFMMAVVATGDGQAMVQASANLMGGRGVARDVDAGIELMV